MPTLAKTGPFSTTNAQKKLQVIKMLNQQGYATYARRFELFKFIVTDNYFGHPVPTAACLVTKAIIVINPGFFPDGHPVPAVSVIIRHELLHALLAHAARMSEYLALHFPDDFQWLRRHGRIAQLGNIAEDYDISVQGYDDYDKQIVRTLTLNGRFIGGLIAEDDHPEWIDQSVGKVTKTLEQMYDQIVKKAAQQIKDVKDAIENGKPLPQAAKPTIVQVSHSQEFTDMYNKIIETFNNSKYSDDDLKDILARIQKGEDVI